MYTPKFVRRQMVGFRTRKMKRALRKSQALADELAGGARDYNRKIADYRALMHVSIHNLYECLERQKNREELLYLYLIYFSSIGSHMVAKANVWLEAWGQNLSKHGFADIGEHYIQHAKEEVGHDQWHRNDVKKLIEMYRQKFGKNLSYDTIIKQGNSPCVARYYKLSEQTISGEMSYQSLGELYETEIMALDLAPSFIGYCVTELGFEILKGLGFLRGHVVSDIDHIKDNVEQMDAYLNKRPEHLDGIVGAARETIDIYIDYFRECLDLADKQLHAAS